ncbi:MAG: DNA replication/repair protein RecF [Sedimenticolaceae bacterium]
MHIASLAIRNLRVIESLEIAPDPGINFIVGGNGAGKTSILEAIYLAGRGRTFRHKDAGPMIRRGAENVTVVVGIENRGRDGRSTLGLRRERRQLICRLDGKDVKKRSVLAEALPVQWIGSQPQLLLTMGPEIRRRFIDMGLFHVEHSYLRLVNEFQRALRQRNAAIRTGDPTAVTIWDASFCEGAARMNEYRERFVRNLTNILTVEFSSWTDGYTLGFRFKRGWNAQHDLADQLKINLDTDLRMGYSTRGPQRGDLEILADGAAAEKILSRGQQKVLVLAMNLALARMISESKGDTPILLIDDLAAELDIENRKRLLDEFMKASGQVFLTKIEDSALKLDSSDAKTFHVEHGTIK